MFRSKIPEQADPAYYRIKPVLFWAITTPMIADELLGQKQSRTSALSDRYRGVV